MQRTELSVQVGMSLGKVPAILLEPPNPRWLYVIAHGAGAGMRHPFLEMMADRLAVHGVATFRFQFPYMETGGRPNAPPVLEATIMAAVQTAGSLRPEFPLVDGGSNGFVLVKIRPSAPTTAQNDLDAHETPNSPFSGSSYWPGGCS